jgi:hypothetical protein
MARVSFWHLARYGFRVAGLALDLTSGESEADAVPSAAQAGERLADWRRNAPIRSIAFQPPILSDGRDASDVVQVHLEHRLVRRLLSRFIGQGFQSKLSRLSVISGPGANRGSRSHLKIKLAFKPYRRATCATDTSGAVV